MSLTYDFLVIGGGSGGMAAAKEAARLGAKVALFDYVKPSTQGSTWGIGGTCVNVGCIPKKLMHYSSGIGLTVKHDAHAYGWEVNGFRNKWDKLVSSVQNYVKSLNFGYRSSLRSANVDYINAMAEFKDSNSLRCIVNGEEKVYTGKYILISVGGRPFYPSDVQGCEELAITSDDIFSLQKEPGKTLIVGSSYIGLECASFLNELGFEVVVAVRSKPLRSFDRQCADKVCQLMAEYGVKFMHEEVPVKLEKEKEKIKVYFKSGKQEVFDTVLYATGRRANTEALKLENAGIACSANGKIIAPMDVTNVPNIFAIGDTVEGRPELTPVAIKSGEYLARRLFAGEKKYVNYDNVATTVFTTPEYGSVGLTQSDAIVKYGSDDLEIYLSEFTTLEHSAAHREKHKNCVTNEYDTALSPTCLSKLICIKSQQEKVVGFHFVGPNAGEITQGFALALQLGAKKSDFDELIGIHPTDAESFSSLNVTLSSGESWVVSGGCGGGKCG